MASDNEFTPQKPSIPERGGTICLRAPVPGDLGWIVSRHGALYAAEYGWTVEFEALVAGIMADFGSHHDPRRERLWIAERDGERVGSIMLVAHSDDPATAKLRVLFVEPAARGIGVGQLLVDACIRFAHEVGYKRVILWTEDILVAARRIYARSGFRLIASSPNAEAFGAHSMSETWELIF